MTRTFLTPQLKDAAQRGTYGYRFGPPAHDVVAATLCDRITGTRYAGISYYPNTLPAGRVTDLALTAAVARAGDDYVLMLNTVRFAHAVAIDIEGWMPDDNYLNVEPGETTRVKLRPTTGDGPPRGTVLALNGRSAVPILRTGTIDAS
jgi:beta-mannosidase